jgi:hypothetical protein
VLQQEFDDLMRSSATMKVSLTPDRLKTMEVSVFRVLVSSQIVMLNRCTNKRKTTSGSVLLPSPSTSPPIPFPPKPRLSARSIPSWRRRNSPFPCPHSPLLPCSRRLSSRLPSLRSLPPTAASVLSPHPASITAPPSASRPRLFFLPFPAP